MSEKIRFNPIKAAETVFLTASTLYVLTSAFSYFSRKEILERDGHACRECGSTDHLEAAHIDHNKRNKNYDDPQNGRTLCTEHHLQDHILRHGRNGLTRSQNEWAIERIQERLADQTASEMYVQATLGLFD